MKLACVVLLALINAQDPTDDTKVAHYDDLRDSHHDDDRYDDDHDGRSESTSDDDRYDDDHDGRSESTSGSDGQYEAKYAENHETFFSSSYWYPFEPCYAEFFDDQSKMLWETCCQSTESKNCYHYHPDDPCFSDMEVGLDATKSGWFGMYRNESWDTCCADTCSDYQWECNGSEYCRSVESQVEWLWNTYFWYLLMVGSLMMLVGMCLIICCCCSIGACCNRRKNLVEQQKSPKFKLEHRPNTTSQHVVVNHRFNGTPEVQYVAPPDHAEAGIRLEKQLSSDDEDPSIIYNPHHHA